MDGWMEGWKRIVLRHLGKIVQMTSKHSELYLIYTAQNAFMGIMKTATPACRNAKDSA